MKIDRAMASWNDALKPLRFGSPVAYVYNPFEYAGKAYARYWARYGQGRKEVVLVGMNPGPWGMAQTGVPFGDVAAVREWLGIEALVGRPARMHAKRPVDGFRCKKGEVSGRRLWGWARDTWERPERFFSRFFVANYCPLLFLEETGRNRTPDKLPAVEKKALFEICDAMLRWTIKRLAPRLVVGVGAFAEQRARHALSGMEIAVGRITHPSPANPRANQGWESIICSELRAMGVALPEKGGKARSGA